MNIDNINIGLLPSDVITYLFSFVSPKELAILSLVSHCFNENANQSSIWEPFAKKVGSEFKQEDNVKNKVIQYCIEFNKCYHGFFNETRDNINQFDKYLSNTEKLKIIVSDNFKKLAARNPSKNHMKFGFIPEREKHKDVELLNKMNSLWINGELDNINVGDLSISEVSKLFYRIITQKQLG